MINFIVGSTSIGVKLWDTQYEPFILSNSNFKQVSLTMKLYPLQDFSKWKNQKVSDFSFILWSRLFNCLDGNVPVGENLA